MTNDNREFIVSRTFDAPRESIFKAWTEPKLMSQWFGPKGFKGEAVKMDLKPGGTYLYNLTSADGNKMWGKAVYREITKPSKLVWVNSFSDPQGGINRHPMNPTWPLEMLTTVTFDEEGGKTKVTVRWSPLNTTPEEQKTFNESFASMEQGWAGTMDQLTDFVKKEAKAA